MLTDSCITQFKAQDLKTQGPFSTSCTSIVQTWVGRQKSMSLKHEPASGSTVEGAGAWNCAPCARQMVAEGKSGAPSRGQERDAELEPVPIPARGAGWRVAPRFVTGQARSPQIGVSHN